MLVPDITYSFGINLQRPGPFPLSIPTALGEGRSVDTRGDDRCMRITPKVIRASDVALLIFYNLIERPEAS
jgi:hypothetical protein